MFLSAGRPQLAVRAGQNRRGPSLPLPPTYRLRISVVDSDPEIWRLVEVAANLTLEEKHEVIQIAGGWQHSHLHAFTSADGRRWLDEESIAEGLDGCTELLATLADPQA